MSRNPSTHRPSPATSAVARAKTACQPEGPMILSVHTALLVEHRCEVFARLAADLKAKGVRVERASSAAEALRRYARYPTDLLLTNVDLPDQSGWLLSGKLRVAHPAVRIWLYTPRSSPAEVGLANFVRTEELIQYGGDLWQLAEEVLDRLADLSAYSTPLSNRTQEMAAAEAVV